jgi:predicted ATPase/DNA-binding CsgD family transcriptional regulator
VAALPDNRLPEPRTSFIGRQHVLAELRQRMPGSRLVTLTGPGGTGKTRVALEAAASMRDAYPDGVFFVSLAPVTNPELVMATIAGALAITDDGRRTPLEALQNLLRRRHVLLILDNFEQVVDAALDLSRLLAECPRVSVLATSRAPLRILGEQELAVPPLDRDESVRLFVERAQAVNLEFVLTDDNRAAVEELCRRLDDLPLAIELAAARTRLLDPRAMLGRLERRLPLLTSGARDAPLRQQTLRNTIAWSYDLLESSEQLVFRRLAVFVGGCTLDAAQAVCAPEQVDFFEDVDSLVAKNLVRGHTTGDDVRISMLETVHEFALDQLASSQEVESLHERHVAFFLSFAEQAEQELNGLAAPGWFARLETEHDNLRSALEWSLAHSANGADSALRLAGALGRFWWMAGDFGEGSRWLTRTLLLEAPSARVRMKALQAAGWLAHVQRDSAAARTLLEQALAIAEALDDKWWRAWILHTLGRVAYFDGDALRATELGQRSLAIAEAIGDRWLSAWAVHLLGLAAYVAGDYAEAEAQLARCVGMRRALGHLEGLLIVLHLQGVAAHRLGRTTEALELAREALDIARRLSSAWFFICLLPVFASFAAIRQPRRAARLGGVVTAMCESTQALPIPITQSLFDESMAIARRKLGQPAFDAAWAEGQRLSLEAALAEAESVEVVSSHAPSHLTPAEVEVLRRMARGLTSQQIADDLVLAVATVDRHITHIYRKIGKRGRAAATTFALDNGLT